MVGRIKRFFYDWSIFEYCLLISSVIAVTVVGILFGSDWITVSASIVGIITALLLAKGKVLGQIFGIAIVDYNYHNKGIGKKLFKKLIQVALKKYKITLVNGTTYIGSDKMPYLWYDRIGFKKVDNLFIVAGDPKNILKELK
jgi:GNAT superfamily N-acetyltransferase